jgi:hypothetical protein
MATKKAGRVTVTFGILRDALGGVVARPCAVAVLAYLGVRVALVLAHFAWYREPLASVFYPLLVWIYGEPATHFPNDVPAIAALLSIANAGADLFAGSLVQGALVLAYAGVFLGGAPDTRDLLRRSAARYPALLALTAISIALLVLGGAAYRAVAHAVGPAWPLGRVETEESSFLVAALLTLPVAYAPAFLLLKNASVGSALAESLRLFAAHPVATAVLVYPLAVVFLPAGWLFERTDAIVEAFSRAAVAVLFLAEAGLSALTLSLVAGVTTRHVLYRRKIG